MNSPQKMSAKAQLLSAIADAPEPLIQQVLDFFLFLQTQQSAQVSQNQKDTLNPIPPLERGDQAKNPYPLRGLAIEYINPTEPVALEDWEVL